MAAFYADENFDYRAVERLRALGHNVVTVQEAGEQGGDDHLVGGLRLANQIFPCLCGVHAGILPDRGRFAIERPEKSRPLYLAATAPPCIAFQLSGVSSTSRAFEPL